MISVQTEHTAYRPGWGYVQLVYMMDCQTCDICSIKVLAAVEESVMGTWRSSVCRVAQTIHFHFSSTKVVQLRGWNQCCQRQVWHLTCQCCNPQPILVVILKTPNDKQHLPHKHTPHSSFKSSDKLTLRHSVSFRSTEPPTLSPAGADVGGTGVSTSKSSPALNTPVLIMDLNQPAPTSLVVRAAAKSLNIAKDQSLLSNSIHQKSQKASGTTSSHPSSNPSTLSVLSFKPNLSVPSQSIPEQQQQSSEN